MTGWVAGIFVASVGGARCTAVPSVRAVEGAGLEGDRYAIGEGTLSAKPGTGRHVTLIDAAAVAGAGLAPGESRRNIETEGVDLLSLIDVRFRIGSAELVGMRDCPPCDYLQRMTRPDVRQRLAGAGGLRAEVVVSGTIAAGDRIAVLEGR